MESWLCGLTLIVLTIILHAICVAYTARSQRHIWESLEASEHNTRPHALKNWITMNATLGLVLATVHGMEAALWALAYWYTGALNNWGDALFFSIDSMTTRGASGLVLETKWRMMGALEGADGMLLFGISTAFIFAMMQVYWQKLLALRKAR